MVLINEVVFCNVLVTMHLSTKTSKLPTCHLVHKKITNKFVNFFNGLCDDLLHATGNILIAWDTWMVPHTSDPFLSMLVLWIQISEDGTWSMHNEVSAFHKIFGSHTGVNLRWYLLLFLDWISVTLKYLEIGTRGKHSLGKWQTLATVSALSLMFVQQLF